MHDRLQQLLSSTSPASRQPDMPAAVAIAGVLLLSVLSWPPCAQAEPAGYGPTRGTYRIVVRRYDDDGGGDNGSGAAELTVAGATRAAQDFVRRVNLTCRASGSCEQCFNWSRAANALFVTPQEFWLEAARILLAAVDSSSASSGQSNQTARGPEEVCPDVTNASQTMEKLNAIFNVPGATVATQLKMRIESLKSIYTATQTTTSSWCFSAATLLADLELDNSTVNMTAESVAELASLLFVHMAKGQAIIDECSSPPNEEQLVSDLLGLLSVRGDTLTVQELSNVLRLLTNSSIEERSASSSNQTSRARECLDAQELLAAYGLEPSNGSIATSQLLLMSPALLQQMLGGYCTAAESAKADENQSKPSIAEKYGYGTLAVLIISLLPLLGVLLLPCMTTKAADLILTFFTSLAIGTMLGDALLHILPEVLSHLQEEEEGLVPESVWLMLTTCLGIYVFFLFEMSLHMVRDKRSGHSHGGDLLESGGGHGHSHANGAGHGHSHFDLSDFSDTSSNQQVKDLSEVNLQKKTQKRAACFKIKPFAVVVIVGDALHNFADGLAIGTGFASEVRLGISLSIAVCCHEVPHEIGNFAVLLAAGVQRWKVLGLSLLSTSSAFIGLYIGASIGEDERAANYVLAVTAATFFYVALVDLLPSVMQKPTSTPGLHFLMINIGILLGFLVMVLFAIYEENIKV